ncbi:MAG: hypothetical protein AVDCRST_MAG32-1235, partial [uncultured Nocardioides sp.]
APVTLADRSPPRHGPAGRVRRADRGGRVGRRVSHAVPRHAVPRHAVVRHAVPRCLGHGRAAAGGARPDDGDGVAEPRPRRRAPGFGRHPHRPGRDVPRAGVAHAPGRGQPPAGDDGRGPRVLRRPRAALPALGGRGEGDDGPRPHGRPGVSTHGQPGLDISPAGHRPRLRHRGAHLDRGHGQLGRAGDPGGLRAAAGDDVRRGLARLLARPGRGGDGDHPQDHPPGLQPGDRRLL